MKPKKPYYSSFSFVILLMLVNSCSLSNSKELDVDITNDSLTYVIDQTFDKSIFSVKDKSNNETIDNFDVYLDDETLIDDGYTFTKKGSYDVFIKVDGYKDYVVDDYQLVVVSNSLSVDTTLMKTSYKINQALSFDGLVVYDKLNNVVTDYITSYQEGHVFTSTGSYKISVYKNSSNYTSTSFYVYVEDNISLNVDTTNARTIFMKGEEFSLDGVEVTTSTGEEIYNFESSIKDGDLLHTTGYFDVEISYLDYISTSYQIEVIDEYLMEIDSYPKQDYYIGETFDISDLKVFSYVTNSYVDNSNLIFKIDDTRIDDTYIFNEEGEYEITIELNGYRSIGYQIEVSSTGLYVASLPNKLKYTVGESFDTTGLVVKIDTNILLESEYTLSLQNGHIFLHKGTITIKIQKEGYSSTSFDVEVLNEEGLFIKSKPTKEYYEVGDAFDSSGLVVVDNNTYEEVDEYSLSINEGTILNTIGVIEVVVSSSEYSSTSSFEIEVIDKLNVGDTRTLKIYTLNDTHGAFNRDSDDQEAGMAYIGKYFKDRDDENSLFLSMGDMWQGGLESNDTRGNIMVEAMNMIGFDAMALGNHEFDWGEEYIINNLELANFPFLSVNTFKADTEELVEFASASKIVNLAGLKVGIIGSARENMGSSITASIAANYSWPTPNEYIKEESDKLREAGCDVVILAAHDEGFDGYSGSPTDFYDLTTTSSISNERYVDAMLFGHDHLRKAGTYNGVSYVEAGSNGEYFGEVSITVRKETDGYLITSNTSTYTNAYSTCEVEDSEIANLVNVYADVIRDSDEVIYNFQKSYTKTEFVYIVCQAMLWFMETYNNIFDDRNIYMTTHNTAGIRADVSSGPFNYADLIEVCPFDNSIALQKCTVSQVRYMQSNSALAYYVNQAGEIDSDGYYYCGTISYVAEWTNYQTGGGLSESYTLYEEYIISDVVYEFLINNWGLTL